MDHEADLVNAFIIPERRARYLELLGNPKRRRKVLAGLYHLRHLDPRFLVPIPPASHDPKAIGHLLRQHGAPAECHVISTDGELDGRELPLDAVLGQIVGVGGGSLLSCIPGRLGYFEGESERYILSRGPAQGSRPNSGRTSRVER